MVLTVSAEEPLAQQEVSRLGELVSKTASANDSAAQTPQTEIATARPQIVRPAGHRAPWHWLVPAFGIAAAVALWFSLRPTPPRLAPGTQIMAEKTAVPPPPGQQEQLAQGNVPPQPAVPPPATSSPARNTPGPALTPQKEDRSLDRETFSAANAPAKQKDALRDEASNEVSSSRAPNENKKAASGAPSAEADRAVPAAPPLPGQQTQAATVTDAAPAVTAGNAGAIAGAGAATPSAALQAQTARQAPAPQAAPPSGSQLSADNAVKALPLASRSIAAMAKVATAPIIFGTPDRGVEWRIGSAGSIDRSGDQGRTWQSQSSGVSSDLLAGATVSDKIAWIVGRAGTILRTTDGEHWQRATTPPASPASGVAGGRVDAIASSPDLSGVQATDALHAIITSAEGRRYATSDGGRTWTPQP